MSWGVFEKTTGMWVGEVFDGGSRRLVLRNSPAHAVKVGNPSLASLFRDTLKRDYPYNKFVVKEMR